VLKLDGQDQAGDVAQDGVPVQRLRRQRSRRPRQEARRFPTQRHLFPVTLFAFAPSASRAIKHSA
jgi:hypothetical protein